MNFVNVAENKYLISILVYSKEWAFKESNEQECRKVYLFNTKNEI